MKMWRSATVQRGMTKGERKDPRLAEVADDARGQLKVTANCKAPTARDAVLGVPSSFG